MKKIQNEKTEIELLIRGILGKNKFLMLNLNMVKAIDLNSAYLLTYLLDKYEFLIASKKLVDGDGMVIFRRELTNELGFSPYQQRTIEKTLISHELISVKEERVQGETFNRYYFDLFNIYNLVEPIPPQKI
jgi:hypothetical protein